MQYLKARQLLASTLANVQVCPEPWSPCDRLDSDAVLLSYTLSPPSSPLLLSLLPFSFPSSFSSVPHLPLFFPLPLLLPPFFLPSPSPFLLPLPLPLPLPPSFPLSPPSPLPLPSPSLPPPPSFSQKLKSDYAAHQKLLWSIETQNITSNVGWSLYSLLWMLHSSKYICTLPSPPLLHRASVGMVQKSHTATATSSPSLILRKPSR